MPKGLWTSICLDSYIGWEKSPLTYLKEYWKKWYVRLRSRTHAHLHFDVFVVVPNSSQFLLLYSCPVYFYTTNIHIASIIVGGHCTQKWGWNKMLVISCKFFSQTIANHCYPGKYWPLALFISVLSYKANNFSELFYLSLLDVDMMPFCCDFNISTWNIFPVSW